MENSAPAVDVTEEAHVVLFGPGGDRSGLSPSAATLTAVDRGACGEGSGAAWRHRFPLRAEKPGMHYNAACGQGVQPSWERTSSGR